MKSRNCRIVSGIVILFLLSALGMSCGPAAGPTSHQAGLSAVTFTEKITENPENIGNSKSADLVLKSPELREAALFLLLKNGTTKPLVGFAFGDEFDYERFNISGHADGSELYVLKNSAYDGLNFSFNGKGKGFCGLSVSWEGSFFGIQLGEDRLDKLVSILNEPDTYETRDSMEGIFAVWYFEKASLTVRIKDGVIRTVEYRAAEGAADVKEKPEGLTDFSKDQKAGCDYTEAVYQWNAYGSVSKGTYACYHPYDEDYDENQVDAFIKNYLQSQRIHKKAPDGVSYNQNGDPLVEYYLDEAKNQYCFIVHLWAEYWVDYEKGTSKYRDAVYCTTHILNEADKVGSLIYNSNTAQTITRERLYDGQGKRMADISYEYIPGVPFPFLTSYWNLNTGYELIDTVLCRNQKTWFYKEQSQFDQDGNFIRYNGKINQEDWKEYLPYPCNSIYGADGRLKAIREELQESDIESDWGWWDESLDYSGQLEFSYHDNGSIKTVDYIRSSALHGTTDSSGVIEYDEKGRMIYNDYYITHGGHINIYLYEEDSERPWACFYWCSYLPGFENIYLFRPVTQ